MELRWTRLALTDFEQAHDHIAQDNPEVARQIAKRILDATETSLKYPRIGRIGEDEDSREWRVNGTPYLLVYAVKDVVIEVWRSGICGGMPRPSDRPPRHLRRNAAGCVR